MSSSNNQFKGLFMKSLFLFLLLILVPIPVLADSSGVVTLTPDNTLTLYGAVDEEMVEYVANKLPKLSSPTIYVQLFSPGGSVFSGKRVIDQLYAAQAQGKRVVCVAHVAASMAFVILQSPACQSRHVVSGAVLMQHQARATVSGPIHQLLSSVHSLVLELQELNTMQAARLGVPVEVFNNMVQHDLWINSGARALSLNAADSTILVLCDSRLLKRGKREDIIIGRVKLTATQSECPYVVQPKVEAIQIQESVITELKHEQNAGKN